MIQAILLAGLLAIFNPAVTLPGDPPVRVADFKCSDAITRVELHKTENKPHFKVHFTPGRESCEDEIMSVQPIMFEGKRCVIFWFTRGDRAAFCVPDISFPPGPSLGV